METTASPESIAIAKLIKAQMALRDIKQTTVAAETGISKSQLSRKLAGSRRLEFDDILDICRVIDADPQDVIVRGIRMAGTTDPDHYSVVEPAVD